MWSDQRRARALLYCESGSVPAPAEALTSGSSPELSSEQMHIAAHQTPSLCSSLYLAVPPHAVGIDQPAESIS